MLFVDDYSRYCWIFPMKNKSDFPTHFHAFHLSVEFIFNAKIRCLQTVGGGEYTSIVFQKYLHDLGINHCFSCPETPSQNGLAKRKLRHLIETKKKNNACS